MKELLFVAAGGAFGATARYLVSLGFAQRGATGFPWATLTVNLLGAFLIGMLYALTLGKDGTPSMLALLLGTGVLGGFTTFSALSHETLALAEAGQVGMAGAYAFGSVMLGFALAWAGTMAGRALIPA